MQQLHTILVPVYNSSATLERLVCRCRDVMEAAGIRFELVLVDDGSLDGSFEEIKRLAALHPFVRGIRLSRNFGHQSALSIGLEQSRGDFVAIIDDDLQDPPEVLPHFFQALSEGSDVVFGVRRKRKEGYFKRIAFAGFYRLLNSLSSIDIPLDSGDFCAMRRSVVEALLKMPDARPFLRGMRAWAGFRQQGLEYERAARAEGESGYTLRKYLSLALNAIFMFSYLPLRLATFLGLISAGICIAYALSITILWLFNPFDVPGYLSLVTLVVFLGSVQLVTIGTVGEYLSRMNDNVRKWPVAFIAEKTFDA